MLMDAIPMMQCEGLFALDDLSADRTVSCLLLQEFGPAIEPSPDETLQLRKRLATNDMAVGGRPL